MVGVVCCLYVHCAGPRQVLLGRTLEFVVRDQLALPLMNTIRAGNRTPVCTHPSQVPTVSPVNL